MNKCHVSSALRLLDLLEKAGYEARLAGGCVRDRQLGLEPQDFDIATTATPDQTETILKAARCRYFDTGKQHGTISATVGGAVYEITTLRVDITTDGRKAQVGFVDDWREDANRRDFTVNALYEDRNGRVYDFVGGLGDLSVGRLRFIGDPSARIREDYLRILRLFRFWARYSFFVEDETLTAVQAELAGLNRLSHERVTQEMHRFLATPRLADALSGMVTSGVFRTIFAYDPPEDVADSLESLDMVHGELLFLSRLFMLLWLKTKNLGQDFDLTSLPLRLSNAQKFTLATIRRLLKRCQDEPSLEQGEFFCLENELDADLIRESAFACLIKPLGQLIAQRLDDRSFAATLQRLQKLEEAHGQLRRREFPLTGHDLLQSLALQPGAELGVLLRNLKLDFYRGLASSKAELLALAQCYIDKRQLK